MLKIKIETELTSVEKTINSFDPQSPPEAFIVEIRHVLVSMGFHNKYIDMLLNLSSDLDLEIEENEDDNPPESH